MKKFLIIKQSYLTLATWWMVEKNIKQKLKRHKYDDFKINTDTF